MSIGEALKVCLGEDFFKQDVHVVVYGSRLAGRDVDLLIVQPGEPPSSIFQVGQLDICVVSRTRLHHLMELLDVMLVEPVLQGELLFGEHDGWTSVRETTVARRADQNCVNHASRRAMEEYLSAAGFMEGCPSEGEATSWCMQNLTYSVSYASFAQHYAEGGSVCTVEDLQEAGKLMMPDLWAFQRENKKERSLMMVRPWVEAWGRWLCGVGR